MKEAKELPISPLQPPPKDKNWPGQMPLSPRFRPPPPERGYDPRIDPAVQSGRGRPRSPLASPITMDAPTFGMSSRDDPAIQGRQDPRKLSPISAVPPSPRFPPSSSPDRQRERQPSNLRSESRSRPREPMPLARNRSMSRGPRDGSPQMRGALSFTSQDCRCAVFPRRLQILRPAHQRQVDFQCRWSPHWPISQGLLRLHDVQGAVLLVYLLCPRRQAVLRTAPTTS